MRQNERTGAAADKSKNENCLALLRLVFAAVIVLHDHTLDAVCLLEVYCFPAVGKVEGVSCGQGSDLDVEGMGIVHFLVQTKNSGDTVKGLSCMMTS